MDDMLTDRIRNISEKGLSRKQIRAMLLKAGWPEKSVTEYLQKAFKEVDKGTIISVRGLGKSFGDAVILNAVDFDVHAGEIFGIIGMSGAGKSTLLNIMVGFLRPDRGDVVYASPKGGKSVFHDTEDVKRMVGFSTQTPSFYARLTVRENLEHFGALYGLSEIDRRRRANALLDLVDMQDARDSIAAHLSGGMQKRLDIACALLHDPTILFLDEPTADLDPILRRQFWELIRKINGKGTTIVLASHFLAEIEALCTRIAILQNKHMVEVGTADELRNIYSKNYEIYLETRHAEYKSLVKALSKRRKSFAKVYQVDRELVVETPHPETILPTISGYLQTEHEDVVSLHVARPTLGKVFEAVVKR